MSERRWQPPIAVAQAAALAAPEAEGIERQRLLDLATRMPVGPNTLLAASDCSLEPVAAWAGALYRKNLSDQTEAQRKAVVTACGLDSSPVMGLTEDSNVFALVQQLPDGTIRRWQGSGWEEVPTGYEPAGASYVRLDPQVDYDVLAEAMEAITKGGSLILSPITPRGWMPGNASNPMTAAVAIADSQPGTAFAVIDDLDSSAVLDVFTVEPGPVVKVRRAGKWTPDDGSILRSLLSVDPPSVSEITQEQLPEVLRQVDDYDQQHPPAPETVQAAGAPVDDEQEPEWNPATVGGIAVQALDTGRVLMIQRALDDTDPASGTWEFPGGHAEEGDPTILHTGVREWEEETGHPFPDQAHIAGSWRSGPYVGTVVLVPSEDVLDFSNGRATVNPDDPDADQHEQSAWWDPAHAMENPALRSELQDSDCWDLINNKAVTASFTNVADWDPTKHPRGAGGKFGQGGGGAATEAQAQANADFVLSGQSAKQQKGAATAADQAATAAERQRQAEIRKKSLAIKKALADKLSDLADKNQEADDAFALAQAKSEAAEQARRRKADLEGAANYQQYLKNGINPSEAASMVRKDMAQENYRRQIWETQRSAIVKDESVNRMQRRIKARRARRRWTKEADKQITALAAAAAMTAAGLNPPEHSMMNEHLKLYWTKGKGAAKIRWGTHGDWKRCERALAKYLHPNQLAGACANLHRLSTGEWPGPNAHGGKAKRKLEKAG